MNVLVPIRFDKFRGDLHGVDCHLTIVVSPGLRLISIKDHWVHITYMVIIESIDTGLQSYLMVRFYHLANSFPPAILGYAVTYNTFRRLS